MFFFAACARSGERPLEVARERSRGRNGKWILVLLQTRLIRLTDWLIYRFMKWNSCLAIESTLQPNCLQSQPFFLCRKKPSTLQWSQGKHLPSVHPIEPQKVPKAKVQGYQSGFEGPPEAPRPSEVGSCNKVAARVFAKFLYWGMRWEWDQYRKCLQVTIHGKSGVWWNSFLSEPSVVVNPGFIGICVAGADDWRFHMVLWRFYVMRVSLDVGDVPPPSSSHQASQRFGPYLEVGGPNGPVPWIAFLYEDLNL